MHGTMMNRDTTTRRRFDDHVRRLSVDKGTQVATKVPVERFEGKYPVATLDDLLTIAQTSRLLALSYGVREPLTLVVNKRASTPGQGSNICCQTRTRGDHGRRASLERRSVSAAAN